MARIAGASRTVTGTVVGTLAYMSPEQAAGELVDERTDWWALGAVLYEMLAGRPAFGAEDSNEAFHLFYCIQCLDPVPITSIRTEIPDAIGSIVHRLLDKDPARRPAAALVNPGPVLLSRHDP